MPQPPSLRRLTVWPHYARLHPRQKITATLRLTGDWLLQAGFRPGDVVAVGIGEGLLRITRAQGLGKDRQPL